MHVFQYVRGFARGGETQLRGGGKSQGSPPSVSNPANGKIHTGACEWPLIKTAHSSYNTATTEAMWVYTRLNQRSTQKAQLPTAGEKVAPQQQGKAQLPTAGNKRCSQYQDNNTSKNSTAPKQETTRQALGCTTTGTLKNERKLQHCSNN